ncbi:helix-turn-helix domain-containing protein [Polluticaenibacter yanchengensis]|uniref:Helix-turn-helix transcriptional regulator n=1 Tax=Polluticaenibacter yanchengensis TaxID=3014562 RepID=A0ABT4UPC6_9BACT|nr:helix-turn-helix transcriptional regulator [Chitinophagaceae bacterium LY-5]
MTSEEKFYKELGAKIASCRNQKDVNQDVLADFLKLSRPSIVNIEKGRQKPNVLTLVLIANYLQVKIDDLIPKINNIDIDDLTIRGGQLEENHGTHLSDSIINFLNTIRDSK